jgi:hypothetical protein
MDYGKTSEAAPNGSNWKTTGADSIGGVLYAFVANNWYGRQNAFGGEEPREDSIGLNVQRTPLDKPGVTINPRVLIPPSFHGVRIHLHADHVKILPEPRKRRNVDAVLKKVAAHPFKQLIMGRGKDDKLTAANRAATLQMLEDFKIPPKYIEGNGIHSFVFARRFLLELFPLMFQ